MKILSSICLALFVICWIGSYACFYEMGRVEISMWEWFNPFFEAPAVIGLFFCILVVWMVSLVLRKSRIWTSSMVVGFLAVIGLFFILPAPGSLIVYGIRNHVMQNWTLDDLRQFAREIHQKLPGVDIRENDPDAFFGQSQADFDKLCKRYSFMRWGLGGKGNPYIYERDGNMIIEWGGALPGHWGFAIALDGKRIDPDPDPALRVLRMSDDIYFYHGD